MQESIIAVILVDIGGQPHPYSIDNKGRTNSLLIFKLDNKSNSLYFRLTQNYYEKDEKKYLIKLISKFYIFIFR